MAKWMSASCHFYQDKNRYTALFDLQVFVFMKAKSFAKRDTQKAIITISDG